MGDLGAKGSTVLENVRIARNEDRERHPAGGMLTAVHPIVFEKGLSGLLPRAQAAGLAFDPRGGPSVQPFAATNVFLPEAGGRP